MNILNMVANITDFISKNWLDILLVIVGASAFIIYWLQERRKISEAASLIILQVEELQTSIAEEESYFAAWPSSLSFSSGISHCRLA